MLKNLIFDVGNVLLGYQWFKMVLDYGMSEEDAQFMGKNIFEDEHWLMFDAGKISMEDLIEYYVQKMPDMEMWVRKFFSEPKKMLILRPDVWDEVARLKAAGYKIYLLSNYSEELFTIHTEGTPILELADGKVVSYMIHEIKPYPSIYQYLLDTYKLDAAECIFFDDREENVTGGEALGIAGVIVESEEQLLEELRKL